MTIIVADTTCGLPRELLKQRGIPFVPQVVIFGDEAYHDDSELDTPAFLQKLKESPTLPKTAAPEPPLYFPIFEEAKRRGKAWSSSRRRARQAEPSVRRRPPRWNFRGSMSVWWIRKPFRAIWAPWCWSLTIWRRRVRPRMRWWQDSTT